MREASGFRISTKISAGAYEISASCGPFVDALTEMMIGPTTSIQVFLCLQVLYGFPAAYAFPQPIDNVATSEVCRFVDAENLQVQLQEVENDKETFSEHEEYTMEWAVNVMEGPDVADEIAEKYGFVNFGPVSSFEL